METINKTPVTFTEGAVNEIKRLMNEASFDTEKFLRVGVKGGGCSGMTYILDFDTKTDKDEIFEIEGIPCIINPAHSIYLADMEVHWEGGLNSRGFTFNNPNASTTCGCGSSFGV
ncbi:MAG: iron-sulfur cluster assembly accessory protein [Bacteroidota bacterium]|nr:iron-sulfur cluster assembly accessory protein [Bacteroidota bacterium]MDQ6889130.1 iron-sulfur cluster assembly accessory protein [Bacteroidota bacterium]